MKYIVEEIQTNASGTVGTIVSTYDDKLDAESKFHQILYYAAKSELPVHAAVILTEKGRLLKSEYYEHVQQEEPQEE